MIALKSLSHTRQTLQQILHLHVSIDATYYVRAVSGVYEDLVVCMHLALYFLRAMGCGIWLTEKSHDKQDHWAVTLLITAVIRYKPKKNPLLHTCQKQQQQQQDSRLDHTDERARGITQCLYNQTHCAGITVDCTCIIRILTSKESKWRLLWLKWSLTCPVSYFPCCFRASNTPTGSSIFPSGLFLPRINQLKKKNTKHK